MSLFTKTTNGNGDHPMIDLRDVHKYYKTAVGDYHALNSIDLHISTLRRDVDWNLSFRKTGMCK